MKKLMILGAGVYQLPLIKKAKEMGNFVIVVSKEGNYPGFALADKIYYEDVYYTDNILKAAEKEKIDGVCTSGISVALKALGKICKNLNLPGLPEEAARLSTNKLEMKKKLLSDGVRTPDFKLIKTLKEAREVFQKFDKAIIKVVDSSGSRGIYKLKTVDDLEDAFNNAMKITKLDYLIIEEFIEGIEFGAQAFVDNTIVKFIMPHGDYVFSNERVTVPTGHYVPFNLNEEVSEDLQKQLCSAIHSLNFNYCAVNADLILKNDKVYIIEIEGRAGATCLPEILSVYYGIDYYEEIINSALGLNITNEFVPSGNSSAALLLTTDKSGKIISIQNENPADENIINISFDYKIGDHVNAFSNGADRIGQIVVKGENLKKTIEFLYKVKNNIKISIN